MQQPKKKLLEIVREKIRFLVCTSPETVKEPMEVETSVPPKSFFA